LQKLIRFAIAVLNTEIYRIYIFVCWRVAEA